MTTSESDLDIISSLKAIGFLAASCVKVYDNATPSDVAGKFSNSFDQAFGFDLELIEVCFDIKTKREHKSYKIFDIVTDIPKAVTDDKIAQIVSIITSWQHASKIDKIDRMESYINYFGTLDADIIEGIYEGYFGFEVEDEVGVVKTLTKSEAIGILFARTGDIEMAEKLKSQTNLLIQVILSEEKKYLRYQIIDDPSNVTPDPH